MKEINLLENIDTVVSILGTQYKVKSVRYNSKKMNYGKYSGLCYEDEKAIYIAKSNPELSKFENVYSIKESIRHEVIHAYLNESGLSASAFVPDGAWTKNEEMVDWIAIQFPKMIETMRYLNAL